MRYDHGARYSSIELVATLANVEYHEECGNCGSLHYLRRRLSGFSPGAGLLGSAETVYRDRKRSAKVAELT